MFLGVWVGWQSSEVVLALLTHVPSVPGSNLGSSVFFERHCFVIQCCPLIAPILLAPSYTIQA